MTVPPDSARFFDERLLVMPHSYFVNDHRQRYPTLPAAPSRASLGLPEHDVVYCVFGSLPKLDAETVELWLRILQRVPRASLWMLRWPAACLPRIREYAEAAGVAWERFVFSDATEFDAHVARIPLCDVHLDPLHVSTHTVACDVLYAGVPTVTCPGPAIASRVAASIATVHGVPELVAASVREYEETAFRLGSDAAARGALRARLRVLRNTSPVFDTALWVREWERSLLLSAEAPRRHHVIVRRFG